MVFAVVFVGLTSVSSNLISGRPFPKFGAVDVLSEPVAFVVVLGAAIAAFTAVAVGGAVFLERRFSRSEASPFGVSSSLSPCSTRWVQLFHDPAATFRGRCFVLADTSDPTMRRMVYDLSAIGFDVDACDDHEAVMGSCSGNPDDCPWSLVVVDVDFLADEFGLESVVDDLVCLRRRLRNLKVIVVSDQVRRDESDTSRLSMADVTLRAPVTLKRLREGIWDAQSNNMIWQGRVQVDRIAAVSPDDGGGGRFARAWAGPGQP